MENSPRGQEALALGGRPSGSGWPRGRRRGAKPGAHVSALSPSDDMSATHSALG